MTKEDRPTDPAPSPRIDMVHEVVALVIDDDPLSVDLLQYQLPETIKQYLTLNQVKTLSEAFHKIESGERVDVVLLDLGLPGSQGRETLLQFKEHAPLLPVVVLTANDDDKLKSQLLDDGAFSYLVKGQLSAKEVANIIIRVAVGHQTQYRLAPNEPEIFRKSTMAQARLRRAMSLPPESPNYKEEQEAAANEVLMTQAAENSLAHSKLDKLLIEIGDIKYTLGSQGARLETLSIQTARNTGDIENFKDELGTAKMQRVKDSARAKLQAAEGKIAEAMEAKIDNTDLAKARWAAITSILVAIITAMGGALVMRACGQ